MRPENLPLEERLKVAAAASRFFECLAVQRRQDAAIITSLVRTLRNPRGAARVEVEQFVELVSGIGTGFNVLALPSRAQRSLRCTCSRTNSVGAY
jgi:hypothetical protein